jgi:putative aminopeptidase FrvX
LIGNSVSEQTYRTLAGRFVDQAVQAYDPWAGSYQGRGVIQKAWLCERRNNLMFEVADLEHVIPGTPVAFLDRLHAADDHLAAQLDNVVTVAMAIHLAVRGFPGTVFFTAQEEAGRSWRYLLEWFRRADRTTDRLFVLDTSPFADRDSADAYEVILRHGDANAAFSPQAVERVRATAAELGVRTAFKDDLIAEQNRIRAEEGRPLRSLGSTELGRLIAADERITGATIQVPTTGYHTTEESASMAAVVQTLRVLDALLMPKER